jgi:hypothetical protein
MTQNPFSVQSARMKKRRGRLSLVAAALLPSLLQLGGCATMTPEQRAALQANASRRIFCVKGDDCDTKWGRAVAWVSRNSAWKIQTQTDSLIQTFGPSTRGNSTASAFVVNKVPIGDGRHEIAMNSACGNIFGCIPDAIALKAHFNSYVLGEVQ